MLENHIAYSVFEQPANLVIIKIKSALTPPRCHTHKPWWAFKISAQGKFVIHRIISPFYFCYTLLVLQLEQKCVPSHTNTAGPSSYIICTGIRRKFYFIERVMFFQFPGTFHCVGLRYTYIRLTLFHNCIFYVWASTSLSDNKKLRITTNKLFLYFIF